MTDERPMRIGGAAQGSAADTVVLTHAKYLAMRNDVFNAQDEVRALLSEIARLKRQIQDAEQRRDLETQ